MVRPTPLGLRVVTASLLLGLAVARADAPPGERTRADAAFERLDSTVAAERAEGVAALVGLLPGVRGRVIEALPRAPWGVQLHLVDVLAQDRSDEALAALLGHLERTDETQAAQIRMGLVRDDTVASRLLEAYRRDPRGFLQGSRTRPEGALRLEELAQLLRRAEIESLFLSRKSRSGSTGYYKGQYEALAAPGRDATYRRQALEVVTGIALDEALPVPGLYTTGVYRFLRPHTLDEWELRGMAINAVSELCTPQDEAIVLRLDRALFDIQRRRDRLYASLYGLRRRYGDAKPFQDALFDWDDALGEYADLVACLYVIAPDLYNDHVEGFLAELEGYGYPYVPLRRQGYIAGILIRVGWYDRAIRAYDDSMEEWGGSRALGYYNQACAYANWSLQEGLSETLRARLRILALKTLSSAVENGWSDIGWMGEDRDLDPIRDTGAYRDLVAHIERELKPPEDDK